jgi:hypothetical protein
MEIVPRRELDHDTGIAPVLIAGLLYETMRGVFETMRGVATLERGLKLLSFKNYFVRASTMSGERALAV